LIQVDPAGRELYSANADRYLAQLGEVNDRLRSQAGTVPPQFRKLVTNHDAFPYFAQEYGFTVVGSILGSPEAQPAAGELATLVQKVKAENVRAVFSESQFNPKLTQILADEAGVRVVTNLYTDTLSEPGGPADTYVKLLEFDMSTIVTALKGEPLP
jgi:ABC-type Zn uptake system ZnuABC Zn-binding protein ZnuA